MFQKNLEAIKLKNPDLSAKLEKINLADIKSIEVTIAENKDYNINYNSTALHNPIDPVREAKTTWYKAVKTELKKNDIQVVFGLGLGYLFKRAYVNSCSKIFIIEPFIEILRFVLEYVDLSKEFAENRVFITDNPEELLKKIHAEFLSGDKIEYLFLNSYLFLSKDLLIDLTQKTLKICESKCMDQNTIINQCKLWVENFVLNMQYFPESKPIGFFKEVFAKKTALIVSAGPSLNQNLAKIKENRNKFIIIAVPSVLKILINAEIIPDFAVFADSKHMLKHISGIENYLSKINLVINSRAENKIFQQDFKSKLIYFSETDALSGWIKNIVGEEIGVYKSGGTVAILAYYFAKALGCDPIIFTGLDLAFIDNKIYADGHELIVNSDGFVEVWQEDKKDYVSKKLMTVKGYNGEMLPTRDDYALFIRHFNEIFTQEYNPARIINTSVSGAYIEGMEYVEFNNIVENLSSQNLNTDEIIQDILNKASAKWLDSNNSIYYGLKNQAVKIRNIEKLSKNISEELKEICDLFEEKDKKIDLIQNKAENIKDLMSDVRDEVIKNAFLSVYMQNEVWQYAKNYKTSILPSMDDINHNIKIEYDFFAIVHESSKIVAGLIEKFLAEYKIKLPSLK